MTTVEDGPILLSPPDTSPADEAALVAAFRSGWVAPVGPEIAAFEAELAAATERAYAVALASGTAALHLALLAAGIGPGSRVAVATLTFAATANAVVYTGAEPVFVDATPASWAIDPALLEDVLRTGRIDAVITVDLYGQPADHTTIGALCERYGAVHLSDAAEALGALHHGHPAPSFGRAAILSFNGNKIITTSGGGALLTDDRAMADQVRHLGTQARQPVAHYEHLEVGYNYRLSNLLAALGRSQLRDLERRVARRRAHHDAYRDALGDLPGIDLQPEPAGDRSTRWLTVITIDPSITGVDREAVRGALEAAGIETRPAWKPMHLQPVFAARPIAGGEVASRIFAHGLCLPSGSGMSDAQRERVIHALRACLGP